MPKNILKLFVNNPGNSRDSREIKIFNSRIPGNKKVGKLANPSYIWLHLKHPVFAVNLAPDHLSQAAERTCRQVANLFDIQDLGMLKPIPIDRYTQVRLHGKKLGMGWVKDRYTYRVRYVPKCYPYPSFYRVNAHVK